jgi:hypothetical protein
MPVRGGDADGDVGGDGDEERDGHEGEVGGDHLRLSWWVRALSMDAL